MSIGYETRGYPCPRAELPSLDGATLFGWWPVKMMRPRGASTAWGGCPRWAAMVPTTTDVGGVGERRPTATVVGGGGGGVARSTSIGAVADDSALPTGTGGDGDAVGSAHSTTGSGTTTVYPWITQNCIFCTCTRRSGMTCTGGIVASCLAANASNSVSSTTWRTSRIRRMRREMVCSIPFLMIWRTLSLFLSRTTSSSSSEFLSRADNVLKCKLSGKESWETELL
jgi:hypothetical protein